MGFENNSLIVKYWKLYLRNQANESNMNIDCCSIISYWRKHDSEQCRSKGRALLLNLKSHRSTFAVYLSSHVSQSTGAGKAHLCVFSPIHKGSMWSGTSFMFVTSHFWTHALIVFVSLYPQNIKTRKVQISTVQLSFLRLKKKIYGESQWDDWVSKVTCHQA